MKRPWIIWQLAWVFGVLIIMPVIFALFPYIGPANDIMWNGYRQIEPINGTQLQAYLEMIQNYPWIFLLMLFAPTLGELLVRKFMRK